jgi:amino acid adenylation domain-containing protein
VIDSAPTSRSFASAAYLPDLIEVLRLRAARQPERTAYVFLGDDGTEAAHLTYGELDARARAIAARLQSWGLSGERGVLLYPPGLDFVAAFWGCLYAGVVAVPSYPPRSKDRWARQQAIFDDARPAVALTCSQILSRIDLGAMPGSVRWFATDGPDCDTAPPWEPPKLSGADIAMLQYTSGSTSSPKGVVVTRANLLHNEEMIRQAFGQSEDSVIVGWLPLYHDMGLIGNVLQTVYVGARCILLSPMTFLQKPVRWLEAISRYKATTSGGPSFAYELCARKISPAEKRGLDLSSWGVAFNGAEPVRAETLEHFAEAFAVCGFRREAFYPCYGLAEATLFVVGGSVDRPPVLEWLAAASLEAGWAAPAEPGEGPVRVVAGCGRPWLGQSVVIVDPESGGECPPGKVGEIWVSGSSIAQGYWNKPEETRQAFGARLAGEESRFLRTGDLGFLDRGELFVTGRLKDLIVLRGRNHYPQDIEATAERSHPALRPGCGAAFTVELEQEERLVIVQEVERRRERETGAALEAVRRAVAEEHEAGIHEVVLVRAGSVPKTSSGKIRRNACRSDYLAGVLVVLGRSGLPAGQAPESLGLAIADLRALAPELRPPAVRDLLRRQAAHLLHCSPQSLDEEVPLTALGLDSLAAVELRNALETAAGVSLPLSTLLDGASLGRLAAESLDGLADEVAGAPAPAAAPATVYPLSLGQQALWFIDRTSPRDAPCNLAGAARIRRGMQVEPLRRALKVLVDRHPALRTTFEPGTGEPLQRVRESMELDFVLEPAVAEGPSQLESLLCAEAYRPFDLETGPLLRVRVWALPAGEHVLLLALHHLITDFWSLAVLVRELSALYRQECGFGAAVLGPAPADFSEHVDRQRRLLAGPAGERLWERWRMRLAGDLPILDLPTDRRRPPVQTYRGAACALRLNDGLTGSLHGLGRSHGATLFMVLLAAFQTLLHRYTDQEEVVAGSPTSGRIAPGCEGVLGYFVNPVALRVSCAGEPSLVELLARVRLVALEAFENQAFPFAALAERLRPERDAGRSPLFQALFTLHKAQSGTAEELAAFALGEAGDRLWLADLELESVALPERRVPCDLALMAATADGGVAVSLQYNSDLFDASTAARMAGHFANLLHSLATAVPGPIRELCLLSETELRQVEDWNRTDPGAAEDLCLHELFAAQAQRTPDAVALVWGESHRTYRDLDTRAERLASGLRSLGVGPEVRVGLCLERSPGMVVAILAVLKAGGAYVPLDPGSPAERLAFMVESAQACVLLAAEERAGSLPPLAARIVVVDREGRGKAEGALATTAPRPEPGNLAYVIFTSGSTGRPKGVAIEHRSAVARMRWARDAFSDEELAGVLASTSISFDLSVFELFVPLCWGGRIILADNALALSSLPAADQVTLVNTVPSAAAELAGRLPAGVRTVNLAGEALGRGLVRRLYGQRSVRRVLNLYGPSEDTTYSTFALQRAEQESPPSIGRPVAGTRARLLGTGLQRVPVGVQGEIYLGGAGLARGYLGRPELTAERFLPDPFGEPGERLYRTGDLGRYRDDGEIEFLGRRDHQVKVRGFRIELEEIAAVLARHPAVVECVVVARGRSGGEDGATAAGRELVAYVAGSREDLSAELLRNFLGRELPGYMIPARLVFLDRLPRTTNGKVDRRALPEPVREGDAGGQALPRTPTEERVAEIWASLLGVDAVGIHDSFFDLGGHSLLAARVVSRLREPFGVEVPFSVLFSHSTVAALAAWIEAARVESLRASQPPLRPAERRAVMPVSFAQERLWFLDSLSPETPLYNLPCRLRLSGCLQLDLLERSLAAVVRRHETLRTTFDTVDGRPVQVIAAAGAVELPVVDLGNLAEEACADEAWRLAKAEARRPFRLASGPLLRCLLLRLSGAEHDLVINVHHTVCDGWSSVLLVREVTTHYEAFWCGGPSPLPGLRVQYADFAVWQRDWLSGETSARELEHWRRYLADADPVLSLPADRPRPAVQSFRGRRLPFSLPTTVSGSLASLRRTATPFMVLLAAFGALCRRVTGQERLVVGTPVANRGPVEVEELIGDFANTLALSVPAVGDPSFGELVERVRGSALQAYAHQELPFEMLVEALHPRPTLSHNPVFQVFLGFHDLPDWRRRFADLSLEPLLLDNGTARFDLSLDLVPGPEGISGAFEYSTDLFDACTVERMGGHFRALLEDALARPERRLSELEILSGPEGQQILHEWNGCEALSVREGCLHERFESWARRTPGATAVICGSERWTYGELDRRAGDVADHLRRLGVGPETLVGLFVERSVEMIVGLLGILKAGGAYVPLDPSYPSQRLAHILGDAAVSLLLTRREMAARLPASGALWVALDEIGPSGTAGARTAVTAANLAYVIFTSGSTGRPKGVQITHGSAIHLMEIARGHFGFGESDVWTVCHSFAFDFSVWEIWGALTQGGTLVVVDLPVLQSPASLGALLRREGVTVLNQTPSAIRHLVESERGQGCPFPALRFVTCGGEAFPLEVAFRLLSWGVPIWNFYGPTEATVWAMAGPVVAGERGTGVAPLGRPLPGYQVFVLDRDLRLLPIGVPGELHIAGVGLARGYFLDALLTAGRFVPDPFGEAGGRLYRTGDLVRRLATGDVEYLGRIDHQVKVRGFRIELGEVESRLMQHAGVREAAAVVRDDLAGGRGLVAFFAPARTPSPAPEALRAWVREELPGYMVPARFIELDRLSLTPNGKVDRKALSRLEMMPDGAPAAQSATPRRPIEEVLAALFAEILQKERVGAEDDFFELGGHSLLGSRLMARIQSTFGVEMPLRDLFERPTVTALAAGLEALRPHAAPPLGPVARTGDLPLSFAQERLWFLSQLSPETAAYNLPVAIEVRGALSVPRLAASLSAVLARHEALRTTFVAAAGKPFQRIAPAEPLPLPVVDLSALPAGRREAEEHSLACAEAARPFASLELGPLVRSVLLRAGDERFLALLTLHHIVSDGWSMGVLVRETGELYGALTEGREPQLPSLSVQYADYAVWQREWLAGEVLEAQLAAWRERLSGLPDRLDLPFDRPPSVRQSHRGAQVPVRLRQELAGGLSALARKRGATTFMVLLAAFQALLLRLTGQEDVAVGSPVANRSRAETEPLIGFFANTLVLRAQAGDDPSFGEWLGRVREAALGAFANQDLPFERIVEELRPERNFVHPPLFQVMFVLQNAFLGALELPGLTLVPVEVERRNAKFHATLSLSDTPRGLAGVLEHSSDLFDRSTAVRMAECFALLAEAGVARPESRLSELSLLSEAQAHQLSLEWNETALSHRQGTRLWDLFAEQVDRAPEAVALEHESGMLTYRELKQRAYSLAHKLRSLGVGPEMLVAIAAERSPEMVVGMLAVLETGGAWLPLDPELPHDRLAQLLDEARPLVLLAAEHFTAPLPVGTARLSLLDRLEELEEMGAGEGRWRPERADGGPESLVCLLYTSGSTGRPKGVMLTQGGLANRLLWSQRVYPLSAADRVLQTASFSFDFSLWECLAPLISGARLVLARPGGQRDSAYLARVLAEREITVVHFIPSMLRVFLEEEGLERCDRLRLVFSGGEPLPRQLEERFRSRITVPLRNQYGPTETSIDVCYWLCRPEAARSSVPIGRPIDNTQIHLLDRALRPVPLGAAGELMVGGAPLARGYLAQEARTAERFIPDPFSGQGGALPGGRLYRTGDLARHRPDGAIEYLGRIDHQVKLRGFRIEPEEIEAALASIPGVEAAAVILQEDGLDRRLMACIAPSATAPPAEQIRKLLGQKLPAYMVPAAFLLLPSLPRTAAGKLDRRALIGLSPALAASGLFEPPLGWFEQTLAAVWSQVLGCGPVGRHDDFFALGGHSLLATQLVSRIRQTFQVELPLHRLFELPTVSALAAEVETAAGRFSDVAVATPSILARPRRAGREELPLSFSQERLWFLNQLQPDSAFYNIPLALELCGRLALPALAASLSRVVARHEVLRTTFTVVAGRPAQEIAPPRQLDLPLVDLCSLPSEVREEEAARLALQEGKAIFDLACGPLLRATLLRLEAERHVALFTLHHIVADGWSVNVLVRELGELYASCKDARPPVLPELPLQYADFALWQRDWLSGAVLEEQLAYWRQRMAGAPMVLDLPLDRPRPAVQRYRGGRIPVRLAAGLSRRLGELGRMRGATLFMVLLAGYQALLLRLADKDDLVVGVPVAHRRRVEVEGLIGFFVNTLALRGELSGDPGFGEWVTRVRDTALGAYAHQDLPFEKLVEELQPERSLSHSPVFQVMCVLQNAPARDLDLPGLSLRRTGLEPISAKFDLNLLLAESSTGLAGVWEYDSDLLEPVTVERWSGAFEALLTGAVTKPQARLSELSLLTESELHQIQVEWNATAWDYRRNVCLHQLFEEQAARSPESLAVITEEGSWTYRELDERANQLAHHLLSLDGGAGAFIAVNLSRSAWMVAAVLAILKAGGAYVPIERSFPPGRVSWILSSLGIRCMVTEVSRLGEQEEVLAGAPALRHLVCPADSGRPEIGPAGYRVWTAADLEPRPRQAPQRRSTSEEIAYVIFTSGSTGTPKGVVVRHRPVINVIDWVNRRFAVNAEDRGLFVTSLGFDLSVYDIFGLLAAGGSICVATEADLAEPGRLVELLRTEPITFWDSAPAALQQLAPLFRGARGERLRLVFLSGDWIPVPLPDEVRRAFPNAQVVSLGGATEATIWSNYFVIGEVDPQWPSIPYGRPISNARYFVLDAGLASAPIGVAGDLYIGGECLATGYAGDPPLTAAKFVPDPFGDTPGGLLYRTGDRARFRPDGTLQFLGRLDSQVKIRGFRIELGEIEAVLSEHPEVREAVVLLREDRPGDRRLVAYVVGERPPEPGELRSLVRAKLPDYMLPSAFVFLSCLPVTSNGKLDRKALPAPEAESERHRLAPRTPLERSLVDLWSGLLGVEVGVEDDFFALGGHSLIATQLAVQVRSRFGVDLTLRALFQTPTVAGLAATLAEARLARPEELGAAGDLPALTPSPGERHLPFPLNSVQQAYWLGRTDLFELGSVSSHAYSEVDAIGLDLERFERAVRLLIERHDMLRAVVLPDGRQRVLERVPPLRIETRDLRGRPEASALLLQERERMSHQILPGDVWPLFQIRASRLDEERVRLHFSLDALIADAWSFNLLARELRQLYADPEAPLPPVELTFRDYVTAEPALQHSAAYRTAECYWDKRLETLPPAPELPIAKSPSSLGETRFERRSGGLGAEPWGRLKERAAGWGVTPSGLILACFAEALAAWSKSPRFTLNVTLFNRLPLHPHVDRVVGDFTSLVLLAVDGSGTDGFAVRARRIQEQLWQDLDHRFVSGIEVVRRLSRARHLPPSALMPVVLTSTLTLPAGEPAESIGGDWRIEPVYGISQTPQVWLDHQVREVEGALAFNWDAVEEIFPAGLLDDLFGAYCSLLERLAANDHTWLDPELSLLPERHQQLRAEVNSTLAPLDRRLLQDGFEEQARRDPGALAVMSGLYQLTYGELLRRASREAKRLRERGARPNRLVAVVMEKGWEQVVAVLAVLQAGAAYLPISPELPPARLRHLLERGEVELALTQPHLESRLDWPPGVERLCVDRREPEAAEPLRRVQTPEDLAYVIFTSGSTGLPKGVMIDHRGALNTVADVNRRFALGAGDRVLGLSSLSFDLSVWDIFGTLSAGGALVLPEPAAARDPVRWTELIAEQRVTVWNSVPALLEMLVEHAAQSAESRLGTLRLALLSGDWIPVRLPDRLRALAPAAQVVSLGGATEASIWSILYPIAEVDGSWTSIPYGKPMANQSFEVLDDQLQPRPVWAVGELYIGGLGLALGYWRDPERTATSFVVHPRTGERLYRTGDLGRYLPTGDIEFLGREDLQVKIQGYRIELGEIEAALESHPGVKAGAVKAIGEPRGGRRLVAYVVPQDSERSRPDAMPADGRRRERLSAEDLAQLELKLQEKGVRRWDSEMPAVRLPRPRLDPELLARYERRRSHREFLPEAIPFADFGRLLEALAESGLEGARRRYPSEGGLYLLEIYLFVKRDAVRGLTGGTYRYEPGHHGLVLLRAGVEIGRDVYGAVNWPIFEGAGFSLLMIVRKSAVESAYGERAQIRVQLEAGAMGQLLMEEAPAHGIGLCPIGSLELDPVRDLFALKGDDVVLVHSLLGGRIGLDVPGPESLNAEGLPEDRELSLSAEPMDFSSARPVPASEPRHQPEFRREAIPLEHLNAILAALSQVRLPAQALPKYLYPSAGTLYPVQTYLQIEPNRIEGLAAGSYYYDPREHRLVLVDPRPPGGVQAAGSKGEAEKPAFRLFFVGELQAIEPFYGLLSRHFCTLEAGYMGQLLRSTAQESQIGLYPERTSSFAEVGEQLALGESHFLIEAFSCGGVAVRVERAASRPGTTVADGLGLEERVRRFLRQKLPAYMVPSNVLLLEALPLTANGKVDRRALPDPENLAPRADRLEGGAPSTEMEQTIAAIFREVLGRDGIGLHDSFFELGGNSVHLVQVHGRLQGSLGREVPLIEMFNHPTVSRLAGFLDRSRERAVGFDLDEQRVEQIKGGAGLLKRLAQRRAEMEETV